MQGSRPRAMNALVVFSSEIQFHSITINRFILPKIDKPNSDALHGQFSITINDHFFVVYIAINHRKTGVNVVVFVNRFYSSSVKY